VIRRNINRIINKISKHLYRVWFGRRLKLDYNKNYNIAGNVRDLIIAFSVLFSEGPNPAKEYNCEIPTVLLVQYANLLGIQVNISRYVTTMMIRNCNNYDSIKLDIFSKLINKLEEDRDIDSIAFLHWINSLKHGQRTEIIVMDKYSILPWGETIKTSKTQDLIYTFGQKNCEVLFCSINDELFFMTHYGATSYYKKDFKEKYIQKIRDVSMKMEVNVMKFYIISNCPYILCDIVNDIFDNYSNKIFYHVKDASMIYAIKVHIDNEFILSYFRTPKLIMKESTGLYSTGAYMMPSAPFKRLTFEKFK